MVKRRRRQSSRRRGDAKFYRSLRQLKSMSTKHRCQAMKMANDNFVRKFCAHVRKLRQAKLKPEQRKILARHKSVLKKLANNRISLSNKRKILSQRGGFLPLLPMIMSTAAPLLGKIAKSVLGGILQ